MPILFIRFNQLLSVLIMWTVSFALLSTPAFTVFAQPTGGQMKISPHAQSAEVKELWDDLHRELKDLGERWEKHHKLPPSSWLPKETQKTNKKKIDQLAAKLLEGVGSSPLDAVLKQRKSIVKKIDKKMRRRLHLRENLWCTY